MQVIFVSSKYSRILILDRSPAINVKYDCICKAKNWENSPQIQKTNQHKVSGVSWEAIQWYQPLVRDYKKEVYISMFKLLFEQSVCIWRA